MYNNEGQAWESLLKAISLSCHGYKVNEQHNEIEFVSRLSLHTLLKDLYLLDSKSWTFG